MATNWGLVINACVVTLAAVFSMVALGSRGWSSASFGGFDFRFGLYTYCVEGGVSETCRDIESPSGELKATRSLVITGLVQHCIAAALVFYHLYRRYKDCTCTRRSHLYGAIVNACLATIMNTIAKIVYSTTYDDDYSEAKFEYAFYLLIAASINVLCGTIGVTHCSKSKPVQPSGGRTTVITTTTYPNATQPYPSQQPKYQGNSAYPPPPYGQSYGSYPAGQPDPYGYNGAHPPPAYPATGPQNPAYPPPPPTNYNMYPPPGQK